MTHDIRMHAVEQIMMPSIDSVEELTDDQGRFLRFVAMYHQNDVDGSLPRLDDEELIELFDDIKDQTNACIRDNEGRIIAAVSFDTARKNGAFLDGYAVDPSERRRHYGTLLARFALEVAKNAGRDTLSFRSQITALDVNERVVAKLGYDFTTENPDGKYPITTVHL